jgi:hypothetical protein
VAIRKNRPVLYEVVRLGKRTREPGVLSRPLPESPGGVRTAESVSAAPSSAPAPPPPRPLLQPNLAPSTPPTRVPPRFTAHEPPTRAERLLAQILQRRLRIEMSGLTAGVIALALLLVLAVTFEAGRRSARPVGAPAVEQNVAPPASGGEPGGAEPGLAQESAVPVETSFSHRGATGRVATPVRPAEPEPAAAAPPVAPDERSQAAPAPPPAAEQMNFQKGVHYLVIQHFPRGKQADAEAVADFLRTEKIACTLMTQGSDLVLVANEGFMINQKGQAGNAERARCDKLKQEIKRLARANPAGARQYRLDSGQEREWR